MPIRPVVVLAAFVAVGPSARADVFEFPHILEISGALVGTPLGTAEIPYQASNLEVPISIETAPVPPALFSYSYLADPAFPVDLELPGRGGFDLRFEDAGGESTADPADESRWLLTMRYRPVALVGGVEYTLPEGGVLTFVRPHGDPQPLPVESDELRHTDPVVFLIKEPIFLFPTGDVRSMSLVRIDAASRIVINAAHEPVPAPGGVILLLGAGVTSLRPRKR
jgi:hypothetical protein